MYIKPDMGFTKAQIAVALKQFNYQAAKLRELTQLLHEQCEEVYGHDFGPEDESNFCQHCEMLNDRLTIEAEEDYEYSRFDK